MTGYTGTFEVVPDQRIVFEAFPKMTIARLGHRVISAGPLHTWTWAFAPEGAGTRLTLVVDRLGRVKAGVEAQGDSPR